MLKSRLFIGSSSESYNVAKLVKQYMESEYDCVIWKNDGFFKQNESTYDNLLKEAVGFDFALFIGGKDDFVVRSSDGTQKDAPRDNVYLEFGLYAGILSQNRTFFLIQKGVRIASDLSGITLMRYQDGRSIKRCCAQIKQEIEQEEKINRVQLLPSTSLAMGYYTNFLEKLGREMFCLQSVTVLGKKYDVESYAVSLKIMIPDADETDWEKWADEYYQKNGFKWAHLNGHMDGLRVQVNLHALQNRNEVLLADVPMTLRASFQAVDMFIGKNYVGTTKLRTMARKKEINNFVRTLNNLILEDSHVKNRTKIETI